MARYFGSDFNNDFERAGGGNPDPGPPANVVPKGHVLFALPPRKGSRRIVRAPARRVRAPRRRFDI